jgi:hypothetical protein
MDVCIPKVNAIISETEICHIIALSTLGEVIQYKEIPWKLDSHLWKRVLLKIKWNPNHHYLKELLQTGKNIKIVYDQPWFWLIYLANYPM